MKQIRKLQSCKKMLTIEHLCICYLRMGRSIDKRWNRLYPDIIRLVQGLERLGLEYHNGEARYGGVEGE